MGQIKKLSLKKYFVAVTILFLLAACVLSGFALWGLHAANDAIIDRNIAGGTGQRDGRGPGIILVDTSRLSGKDQSLLDLINVMTIVVPVLFVAGSLAAAISVFYRTRLKKPLALLSAAAHQIADHNLDFKLDYPRADELGDLCGAFENMRAELKESHARMWRITEERKRLNAAFAHDLRTPITVLKGYTDLLLTQLPNGRFGPEKLLSTASLLSENVLRLEHYVDSVADLQKLEDLPARRRPLPMGEFLRRLQADMAVLAKSANKELSFRSCVGEAVLQLDEHLIMRVLDNLIANALRYARHRVSLDCSLSPHRFTVEVADDGPGFSPEELKAAAEPYYKNPSVGGAHLGLGLYIGSLLCGKHGGGLRLANAPEGGARVTAAFAF